MTVSKCRKLPINLRDDLISRMPKALGVRDDFKVPQKCCDLRV